MSNSVQKLFQKFLDCFEPPERIAGSDWALKYRRLSPEASSKAGGTFDFSLAPWQPEIIDSVNDLTVRETIFMAASQVGGKTEIINNIIGATIDVFPCPMLMLQPTLNMGESWSKDRFSTMLRDTTKLHGKVKEARTRDADNTIMHKRFPGGHITIAGANSPASLASRPIRICFFDEIDRYPESAGGEGDPIKLAEKRTESFPDAFFFKTSTPTIKGRSKIEANFDKSDKRFRFIIHKSCGHQYTFKRDHLKWEPIDISDAWLECPSCLGKIRDDERREMVTAGEWIPTAPFKGVRGYHLNGIYNLFPAHRGYKDRLHEMVATMLEAAKDPAEYQVWVNTFLAETYELSSEKIEPSKIQERAEDYGGNGLKPIIPAGVGLLLCGIDVQQNRLELEVSGFGRDMEWWGIQRKMLVGATNLPGVWEELDDFLLEEFPHENGGKLHIAAAAVDIGDGTNQLEVMHWFRTKKFPRAYAVKGSSTPNARIITPTQNKKLRYPLVIIGTDTAKLSIYSWLSVKESGPRYMHFPKAWGYDDEFYAQLVSEAIQEVTKKGKTKKAWVKLRDRNEALDIRVYTLGCYQMADPRMKQLMAHVEKKTPPKTDESTSPESVKKDYVLHPPEEKQPAAPEKKAFVRAPKRSGGWVNGWRK